MTYAEASILIRYSLAINGANLYRGRTNYEFNGMITPVSEALSRFMRVGALISLLGAFHTLTLLLTWFAVTYDTLQRQALLGYWLNESFMLSLAAGALAGLAGIIASLSRKISIVKIAVPSAASASAALAIFSPIYSYILKMPQFDVTFNPEIGLFAAIFSGIGIAGAAVLAGLVSLSVKTQQIGGAWRTPAYQQYELESMAEEPGQVSTEQPVERPLSAGPNYSPAQNVPEGSQCVICYDQLTPETAYACNSCGALFHKDCADAWSELGGQCPNCGARLSQ